MLVQPTASLRLFANRTKAAAMKGNLGESSSAVSVQRQLCLGLNGKLLVTATTMIGNFK